jgi:hypothetical protein
MVIPGRGLTAAPRNDGEHITVLRQADSYRFGG